MVVGTMFEDLLNRKRDIEQHGSPSIGNLELYAIFVPPRKYLRKRRCIRPTPPQQQQQREPTSPPTLSRTVGAAALDLDEEFRSVEGQWNGLLDRRTPNNSFETQKSGSASRRHRYQEDPGAVMQALVACMKQTESSRSKLFLHRQSFPKDVLEMSDKLLHRNTTRKKLIWMLEEELGAGGSHQDPQQHQQQRLHESSGDNGDNDEHKEEDADLTMTLSAADDHTSPFPHDHNNNNSQHISPDQTPIKDPSCRSVVLVKEDSPVQPCPDDSTSPSTTTTKAEVAATTTTTTREAQPLQHTTSSPSRGTTIAHCSSQESYASHHSPSRVSLASDVSAHGGGENNFSFHQHHSHHHHHHHDFKNTNSSHNNTPHDFPRSIEHTPL